MRLYQCRCCRHRNMPVHIDRCARWPALTARLAAISGRRNLVGPHHVRIFLNSQRTQAALTCSTIIKRLLQRIQRGIPPIVSSDTAKQVTPRPFPH
jgi:hypothetical protein